ncbi:MAG: hypothetical protein AAFX81_05765 [Pseudomonadota bacterium]
MAGVHHRVGVAGDINRIYRAMHEPSGLAGWWASTADGTPEVGQVVNLHFEALTTLSFEITALEENALVRLQCVSGPGPWQNCQLDFTFQQGEKQIWVDLIHENKSVSESDFLYFRTKWPIYLLSMRDLIETGTGTPYPKETKIQIDD